MAVQDMERGTQIVIEFLNGARKTELARKHGISKQRIEKILEQITGSTSPSHLMNIDLDWKELNRIRRTLNISETMIAKNIKVSLDTVRHVFSGDGRYTKTQSASKVFAEFLRLCLSIYNTSEDLLKTTEGVLTK